MTVDEFWDWPGDGTGRLYQLIDGRPRAMVQPTWRHGTIQGRLTCLLLNHLDATKRDGAAVPGAGVVPRVKADTNMRIPDIAVTCTPDEEDPRALPEPVALIEILSPTNRRETWEAVWTYTTIPSLREILVLQSLKISAQFLRRGKDGSWPERADELGPDDTLVFASVGFSCALKEVYATTHLAVRASAGRRSPRSPAR